MKQFNSKIILFGEYGILLGSKALVMPYDRFFGKLEKNIGPDSKIIDSNRTIRKLIPYLASIQMDLTNKMNIEELKFDLNQGAYFNSNIPNNYGLGSSGSLCAALYDRYTEAIPKPDKFSLANSRKDLSLIESFFHGKSSGTDPLCAWYNKPLIVSKIETGFANMNSVCDTSVFLIDTLQTGSTLEMVNLFKRKWEDQDFLFNIMNRYIPLNNRCIDYFLKDHGDFEENIFELSYMQYEMFNYMIPAKAQPAWLYGLQSALFNLKLCGSGGGGFLLGFTKKLKETIAYFNERNIPILKVDI